MVIAQILLSNSAATFAKYSYSQITIGYCIVGDRNIDVYEDAEY